MQFSGLTSVTYIQLPHTGPLPAALGIRSTSMAYIPPLGRRAILAAYTQQSGIGPLLIAYIAPLFQNFPSTNHPPMTMITTIIRHNRELSNLAKIYTNDVKYNSYNDNFIFKFAIFYDISFRANVLPEIKIKVFPIMLKSPASDNCPSNIGIGNIVMNSN